MEQAFKSMMTQAPPNSFGSNSPFPFSMPPQASPTAPSSFPYLEPKKDTSPQVLTVDVSATAAGTSKEVDVTETPEPSKKFGMAFRLVDFLSLTILEWKVGTFRVQWHAQFVSYHCCAFILINENTLLIGDAAFLNVDLHLLHISGAHSDDHN